MQPDSRLWKAIESYVGAEGVELDDIESRGHDGARLVRVIVDAPDSVTVDRLAELSRGLGRMLDEDDLVQGKYTLEVTSPGLERQLRRPRHFVKAVGREVSVKTNELIDGAKRHRGILESADDTTIVVALDGATRTIPLASVAGAKTIFDWEKAMKGRR